MIKTLVLGATFACLAIPAMALDVDTAPKTSKSAPAVSTPDSAAPADVAQPAGIAITVKAPDGCKFVQIHRPDINPEKPQIYLTFRGYGGTVAAIEACNPDSAMQPGGITTFGVVDDPHAGARVSIKTTDGVGVVGLPLVLANGNVHQVHCKMPTSDGKFPFDFYKVTWKGGLPDAIDMKKVDMADAEGTRICKEALPPDLKAKLDAEKK